MGIFNSLFFFRTAAVVYVVSVLFFFDSRFHDTESTQTQLMLTLEIGTKIKANEETNK